MQFDASAATADVQRPHANMASSSWSDKLRRLLKSPAFADAEKMRLAGVIHTWLLCNLAVCLAIFFFLLTMPIPRPGQLLNFGAGALCNLVLLRLLRSGRVRLAGIATVFGTIAFVVLSNLLAMRPFAIGSAAGFLTLIVAGAMLNRRELLWTAAALIASILASGAYWRLNATPPQQAFLMLDMAIYTAYSAAVGVVVYITTGQLRRALGQVHAAHLELAERNERLERAIASRQGSEQRQLQMTQGLQAVLRSTSMLMQCETVDELWRRAVELARSELGLERCSVYTRESEDSNWFRGTCGTGFDGSSIDERKVRFDITLQDAEFARDISQKDTGSWRVLSQQLITSDGAHAVQSDIRGWVARTPIMGANGKLIGVFYNDSGIKRTPPDPDKQDLLSLYCSTVGRIAERKLLEVQVQQLTEDRVRGATLAERSRLARELHDSVSQALYGIVLGTHTLRDAGLKNEAVAGPALEYVFQLSETALSEMRTLVQALRPEALETDGLIPALRQQIEALCARSDLTVNVALGSEEPPLCIEAKEALYRVALEALQNALKHAQARVIDVRMHVTSARVLLVVRDDGRGFDPTDKFHGHFGLHTMRERVAPLGGSFTVDSAPGLGASVSVSLPHSA